MTEEQGFIIDVKNYENYDIVELKDVFEGFKKRWVNKGGKGIGMLEKICETLELDINGLKSCDIEKMCNKELYKVIMLHMLFIKNDILDDEYEEVSDYCFEFNKIFQVMYYTREMLNNICNTEVALDPERENELNTEIGVSRFTPIDYKMVTPYQQLLLFLLRRLYDQGYMRYGEFCYARVYNEKNEFTYSWEQKIDIEQFIYNETQKESHFEQWKNLTKDKGNLKAVSMYLQTCVDPQFRDLKKDRNIFSFKNGVYIAKRSDSYEDYFYKYGDIPQLPPETISCKYFNVEFNNFEYISEWYDIPTPAVQSILDYQFRDNEEYIEICKWVYILIGRLLYNAGEHDDWQIMPFVRGIAGSGKCQLKGTKNIMYDGKIKKVEDIKIGEYLMGDDSKPRKVSGVCNGIDKMYTITNTENESYTVNSKHILSLKFGQKKKLKERKDRKCYQIDWFDANTLSLRGKSFSYKNEDKEEIYKKAKKEFEELKEELVVDIPIEEYMKVIKEPKKDFLRMLKGYKVGVEFPEKELPIDPYMIGCWIGDGTSKLAEITNQDAEVIIYFMKNLGQYDCYLNHKGGLYRYKIESTNKKNYFREQLKNLDLINNKHIPDIYKINSRENRLKLLAGLIDTDGNYHKKNNDFEFTQKNERVMDDVIYLVRSLGFSCQKREKKTSWTHKGVKKTGTAWRICINGEGIEDIPTRIKRKQAEPRIQCKNALVSGITIKEHGIDEYYGFELDGNGRFLLEDFTVTHNSSLLTQVVQKFYDPNDIGILSNDLEKTFGLSGIFDKYLFIGPEIKKNFALSQALLQSMISAEDVSIPVKHKTAESIKWKIPGIMAGNEIPSYQDSSGSISRRFVIIDFRKLVKAKDSDPLLRNRLNEQVPETIKKCNLAYLDAVKKYGDKNIWPQLPKFFQQTKDKLKEQTNSMQHFLTCGKVRYGEHLYYPEKEFKTAFYEHCKDNNFSKMAYTSDLYELPFYEMGDTNGIVIKVERKRRKWPRETGAVKYVNYISGIDVVEEEDE